MQKNGAGLHTGSSCYWDNTTDGTSVAASTMCRCNLMLGARGAPETAHPIMDLTCGLQGAALCGLRTRQCIVSHPFLVCPSRLWTQHECLYSQSDTRTIIITNRHQSQQRAESGLVRNVDLAHSLKTHTIRPSTFGAIFTRPPAAHSESSKDVLVRRPPRR
eukprot:scaffold1637_cov410-Prasinococcus_capsulatus_cf.AAC.22